MRGGGSPKGNSEGNTNVRFHQKDTLKRFFERLEQNGLTINRFRADCGSCSEEIVEEVGKHCKTFYILAVAVGGVLIVMKQRKGLHSKKSNNGIFIYAYSKKV